MKKSSNIKYKKLHTQNKINNYKCLKRCEIRNTTKKGGVFNARKKTLLCIIKK